MRQAQSTPLNLRSGPQGREYDAIADRVAADALGHVLDWGAGYGQMTARLAARGIAVTAYEHWPGSPPGTVHFEQFPALRCDHSAEPVALPYGDGSFAAVLSVGVLEHVPAPEASLAEIHRVLAPGGRLYVYKLPNRFSYLEWIARRAGLYYHGAHTDDRIYTLGSARALLEAHGFDVREARLANLLPLTAVGTRPRIAEPVWRASRALEHVPGVARLASNVELVADRR